MKEKGGKGVGASLRRKEDRRHLHGRGQFVSDIRLPGTLEVAFVRSAVAHGTIKSIHVPGGKVFTARDFPDLKPIVAVTKIEGFKYSEHPALASERVRFAGEAIAMAVGATRGEAEDVADAVVVEIDELPAVVDMLDALKPGAPLVREEWGDNVFVKRENAYGDVEAARRNAAVTVTREYRMNRQSAVPLEGRAILAEWNHRLEELTVYTGSQSPHQTRVGLAQVLGLEERQLRLISPDMGGGFGSKRV
ncbi:MAG TPA: molybdopterin cofactor-binding domain-containing protein, partial [Burkholderiales bacterium]|nr:molybdopterin cofactor-binding domain-containing protein [Burkholderiales bacterium]